MPNLINKFSEFFKNTFNFIKKNPSIIYSLFLIVAITGIVFFSSYFTIVEFQKKIDSLLRSKAILAEDIFHILDRDFFDDTETLQKRIDEIESNNSEIGDISILFPAEKHGEFEIKASTREEDVGKIINSEFTSIAWSQERPTVYPSMSEGERFWNVWRQIKEEDGTSVGLINFQMSLLEHDNLVNEALDRIWIVSIVSLMIVLLLVANHVRLFKYAVKATKLEEVDRMKDEFISMASHELKSPLTAIRGYVDLLKEKFEKGVTKKDEAEGVRYLNNMDMSVSRLDTLITDILEVSRIEQNRLPIEMKKIEISAIIRRIADNMRINAEKKNLKIVYKEEEISAVLADPERVKQVIVNLISNAIKYTQKGKIKITTKEDEGFVYVVVADTGMGISAENMENLFSKFYRIKNEKTARISGTGLGLWISKEISKKMGGDLTVESIQGVGSHFTLKLKKASRKL